jgi:hypothetical protein
MKAWAVGKAVDAWTGNAGANGVGECVAADVLEGFVWRGTRHRVNQVCNRWRVHTRWWEPGQAVWREYNKIVTDTGILCQLYQDLAHGGWFLAMVYD